MMTALLIFLIVAPFFGITMKSWANSILPNSFPEEDARLARERAANPPIFSTSEKIEMATTVASMIGIMFAGIACFLVVMVFYFFTLTR